MTDHDSFLLYISAFSGLAGALLTQLMTGTFSYFNDRRKQKTEVRNIYRGKKVEIGENFYFMNGELMSMIKKNVAYWKNRRNDRGNSTLQFLKLEMDKLDTYQRKLNAENWKYNLIGIYFTIPFSVQDMLECNNRSHELYLRALDLSDKISTATATEREELYKPYHLVIFDLCSHYEQVYSRIEENMMAVKDQLLADFHSASPSFF